MKAKLFKTGNEFLLQSEDGETLGITSGITVGRKLSIKNCEAIEFGYDLDELAENTYREYPTDLKDSEYHYNRDYQVHKKRKAFIKGFKKALEILGDKKYTDGDIKKALEFDKFENEFNNEFYDSQESFIQSLQQTEWDVEVHASYIWTQVDIIDRRMNTCESLINKGDIEEPMLDKDGCLILKRI